MLIIFAFLCAFDVLTDRFNPHVVMAGIILAAVFTFSGDYISAITMIIFTVYKPEQYRAVSSIVLIAFMFLITIITTLFIDPALGIICIRALMIATIAKVLSKQIQTLDRFLGSYYCRGISRKTASSIIKRSYMLTITSLVFFIIVGFMVQPGETTIPIPDIFVQRVEDNRENTNSVPVVADEDANILSEEAEEIQAILMLEPEVESEQQNVLYLVILVVVAVLTLFFAILLIKSPRPESQFEDYDDIIEEAALSLEKTSKKRGRLFNVGVNFTIRRLFKRKVSEYVVRKDMRTQKSDTPKKLAGKIREWEDIEALEQLYQKARYSGKNVTRIELNKLK
jgi:hypothetical protein